MMTSPMGASIGKKTDAVSLADIQEVDEDTLSDEQNKSNLMKKTIML